jgi:hypothetical protein
VSEIHAGSHEEAFDRFVQDTGQVASWFTTFALAVLRAAVEKHLGGFAAWDQNRRLIMLEGAPSIDEFQIPFFMETGRP